MNKATLVIALAFLCATTIQAQDKSSSKLVGTAGHSCMMMSDSIATVLGLTADQADLVKASDARCMAACAKMEGQKEHAMDHAAMAAHDTDMKEILSAEQYLKWSTLCTQAKAENGMEKPMGDPMKN